MIIYDHVYTSVIGENFSPLPVKTRRRENRMGIRKTFDIKTHCTCRMPHSFQDNMIK